MTLIGDIGGLFEILVLVCGIILVPLSHQSFITEAVSKLYVVEGTDSIKRNQVANLKEGEEQVNQEKQSRNLKPIKINFCQSCLYAVIDFFSNDKMTLGDQHRLFKKAVKQLNTDLSIESAVCALKISQHYSDSQNLKINFKDDRVVTTHVESLYDVKKTSPGKKQVDDIR